MDTTMMTEREQLMETWRRTSATSDRAFTQLRRAEAQLAKAQAAVAAAHSKCDLAVQADIAAQEAVLANSRARRQ